MSLCIHSAAIYSEVFCLATCPSKFININDPVRVVHKVPKGRIRLRLCRKGRWVCETGFNSKASDKDRTKCNNIFLN